MLMQAKFTHADIERAFADYADRNGRKAALAVLVKTTGTSDLAAIAENHIVVAMAALVGGLSFGGGTEKMVAHASPSDPFKFVHDKLNSMATSIFAERRNANS